MADARNILVGQLSRYNLCKHCLDRHGSRQKPAESCVICRGLMGRKDSIIQKIVSAAKAYDYETFLIGAVLPTQIYEREDAMRARLKIRGREGVKSQLTRELGSAFAKATSRKVDYLVPDLVINLVIDKENNIDVSTRSRPLILRGRYTKSARGLAQKQDRCPSCEGKGCNECGHSGLSKDKSVEGIITKHLMLKTGGQTPKFSWLGSEDRSSLVLGKGRPFYAKVINPRRRHFRRINVREDSVAAVLSQISSVSLAPIPFIVKTRISIKCEKNLAKKDLIKLRTLEGADVRFDNRSRIATKKIYSATPRRVDDNTLTLTIVADGGLMIKQLVGGQEYMSPNISELLGSKCDCIAFDILDVQIQEPPVK